MREQIRYLCILLVAVLLFSGCAKNTLSDVPKLLEPAAANSAYRPVERGDIGDVEIGFGTVVPTDYCSFYDTNVKISEISVEVGDYVEKGDVVAYADIEEAQKTLTGLQQELTYENQTYELNCKIAEERIAKMTYEKQCLEAAQASGEENSPDTVQDSDEEETQESDTAQDAAQIEDLAAQIATAQEDLRYDGLLHQYRVGKLNESIGAQQAIITDGTLRATHSGYVTFTKNIAKNSSAGASENIVIISDLEDPYIELSDVTVNSYSFSDYEVKYINIEGEAHAVTEIPYTSEELILAKAAGSYPNVRLTCGDVGALTIGDTYPVYYRKKSVQDVLIIGKDSLYEEDGHYFVYVKTKGDEKEKREITVGEEDTHYIEVTGGLSEGELVYYSSDARMPAGYDAYTVGLSDFELSNYSKTYSSCNSLAFWYTSDYEGTITDIAVEADQQVKKGDLLYVVDTGEGKAALTQAQNQINQENLSYEEMGKGYDSQLAQLTDEYEIRIVNYEKELAALSHAYRLRQLQDNYNAIGENNDGNGKVSVYADKDGTVSKILLMDGDKVSPGTDVLSVSTQAGEKLLVEMAPIKSMKTYGDNIADVGEQISIQAGDLVYTGTCIGWTVNSNNSEKAYLTTEGDTAYLSHSMSSGYEYPAFYVEMDDVGFYEEAPTGILTFSYICMKDVAVIPSSLVHVESEQVYFVWRIQNDQLVKQYVQVSDTLVNDGMQVVLSGIKEGDVLAAE
ncbi:MAG: biotin/lipoyl-binding protein [Lachnospiraceae bacterium]|nr:biotin/lipoyl-binding protein [Lachnospiraceae bacterium]